MKLTIISDRAGRILATSRHAAGGKDAPSGVRIDSQHGQQVHEIEVADHLAAPESIHKLYGSYRVEVIGHTAKLVERH
jgi:hypothetical protein